MAERRLQEGESNITGTWTVGKSRRLGELADLAVRAIASLLVHTGRMTAALATHHAPRRSHSRLRLGIPARLLSLDGQQAVTLVDLSQSGAQLRLLVPGRISGGLLGWLGFEAFGDTAWQIGDRLALSFDAPIELPWVVATRQRAPVELEPGRALRHAAREFVSGVRTGTMER